MMYVDALAIVKSLSDQSRCFKITCGFVVICVEYIKVLDQ